MSRAGALSLPLQTTGLAAGNTYGCVCTYVNCPARVYKDPTACNCSRRKSPDVSPTAGCLEVHEVIPTNVSARLDPVAEESSPDFESPVRASVASSGTFACSSTEIAERCPSTGYAEASDISLEPRSVVCDACVGCGDVCGNPACCKCNSKPGALKCSESGKNKLGEYTMCQIRRHSSNRDCWLVAHGKVYDATGFMQKHPAGVKPILKRGGLDCTADYDFHSKRSHKQTWAPLEIGRVVRCSVKDPKKTTCTVM